MLCGYLPFDDDPNNPEGNDVDCLYLYISTTELNFPDWVSEQAKNLLRMILVPDPRYRAGMQQIMIHPWCSPCVQIMKESLDYTVRYNSDLRN